MVLRLALYLNWFCGGAGNDRSDPCVYRSGAGRSSQMRRISNGSDLGRTAVDGALSRLSVARPGATALRRRHLDQATSLNKTDQGWACPIADKNYAWEMLSARSHGGSGLTMSSLGTVSAISSQEHPAVRRATQQRVAAVTIPGNCENACAGVEALKSKDSLPGDPQTLNAAVVTTASARAASARRASVSFDKMFSCQSRTSSTFHGSLMESQYNNDWETSRRTSSDSRSSVYEPGTILSRSSISSSTSGVFLASSDKKCSFSGSSRGSFATRNAQGPVGAESLDCTMSPATQRYQPSVWQRPNWRPSEATVSSRSFEVSVLMPQIEGSAQLSPPTKEAFFFPNGERGVGTLGKNSSSPFREERSSGQLRNEATLVTRPAPKTFISSNLTAATPPTNYKGRTDVKGAAVETLCPGSRTSPLCRQNLEAPPLPNSAMRLSCGGNSTGKRLPDTRSRYAPSSASNEPRVGSRSPNLFSGRQSDTRRSLAATEAAKPGIHLDRGKRPNAPGYWLPESSTNGETSDFLASTTSTSCEDRIEASISNRSRVLGAQKRRRRKQAKRRRDLFFECDKEWSEIGLSVYRVGIAMYHSCLVVDNVEWHYWQGIGVEPLPRYFDHQQQSYVSVNHVPHITYVPIQTIFLSPKEIATLCDELGESQFSPYCYDIIRCNCNHFTYEVLSRLDLEHKMPFWINRLARTADVVCHRLPFIRFWIDALLSTSSTKEKITNEATKKKPASKQQLTTIQA